jgi:hypothetical protein
LLAGRRRIKPTGNKQLMNDLSPFPMAEDDPMAAQSSQRAVGTFLSFLRFRKKEV